MNRARVARAGTSLAAVALAAALLVGINWLASRHWARADWTKTRISTLSSTTKRIVRGLRKPVRVTAFMREENPLHRQVRGMLGSYKALSPRQLEIEFIDPQRNPARAGAAAQELGGVREGTVVFRSGDRRKHVEQDQLAEYDFAGMQQMGGGAPEMKAFKGEEAFTSALLTVSEGRVPRVYFSSGHGEGSIDSAERGRGFAEVKQMLERDNLTVAKWESLGKGEVPADADAIVVGGPRTAFLEPEAAALERYLAGGGAVLMLLDPVLPVPGAPPADLGLGGLLAARGVKLGADIVVDPANALPLMGAETVFANRYGSHPIVRALSEEGLPVILTFARSVSRVAAPPPGSPSPVTLVETSADGWGETSLADLERELKKDPADTPGPVSLAVAVGPTEPPPKPPAKTATGRLVVVGNSRFAADGALGNAGNANLFRNAVHWLTGAEKQIGIAPKTPEQASLSLTQAQVRRIGLFAIFGLPAMAVVLGIWVWYRRRD